MIEDVRQPDQRSRRVGVPDRGRHEPVAHLLLVEAELPSHPLGELPVRLVEDDVAVILGSRSGGLHHAMGALSDVTEVRGLTREAAAVARILLTLPTPEIRSIRCVGYGPIDSADDPVPADDERGPPGAGRVFERIARGSLGSIGPDRHSVLDHPRPDHTETRLDRRRTRLARELEIGGREVRGRADRLGDHGRRRLDGVGMRLRPHVERSDLLGVDGPPYERGSQRFRRDRDRILVRVRNALRRTFRPRPIASPSTPQTRPISVGVIRWRGTYTP